MRRKRIIWFLSLFVLGYTFIYLLDPRIEMSSRLLLKAERNLQHDIDLFTNRDKNDPEVVESGENLDAKITNIATKNQQKSSNHGSNVISNDCPDYGYRIRMPDTKDEWKTALNGPPPLYVYSAFYHTVSAFGDDRSVAIVKVTATAVNSSTVFCQLWYEGESAEQLRLSIATATMTLNHDTHDLPYFPIIVSCDVPPEMKSAPRAVSLVRNKCDEPQVLLHVHSRTKNWKPTYEFTLCPGPLFDSYASAAQFLQYFEVNAIFGADHFMIYNHSMATHLDKYINYYIGKGKLEIFPWNIPLNVGGPDKNIWAHGQVMQVTDCVFRAMMHSRYVVHLDLDEVMLPLKQSDWLGAIGNDPAVSSYIFPNVFFRKQWGASDKYKQHAVMEKYPLDCLLYTQRLNFTWRHNVRSKYIARPEGIALPGIHYPWGLKPGYRQVNVPGNHAILAHFRSWKDWDNPERMEEQKLHELSDQILQRVSKVVNEIEGKT